MKQQLKDLAPAWRKEIAASKSPLPGRRAIPAEIAPALQGTDFDKNTAARIIAHYGGGIRIGDRVLETKLPGVRKVNSLLTPLNSTGDFSITLNQLAIAGANRPVPFVKNFLHSIRDMVDDVGYNRFLADPANAEATKFITIYGNAGQQSDFLSSTLSKIPIFAQAQKQFERFGNRTRIDGFKAIVDSAAKSAGRDIDDLAKEQIGRSMDRLTGVATTRATDAEGIAQFAPNFFRSVIETVGYAAKDGGLKVRLRGSI